MTQRLLALAAVLAAPVALLFVAGAAPVVLLAQLSAPASAADWPQWRGPDRTGISKETGLLKKWPAEGPPKVYTAKVPGGGHGSPAIVEGKIYLTAKKGDDEVAVCLKESDGSPVWEKMFSNIAGERIDRNVGPRSTPTFHTDPKLGKVIYVLGVTGTLACLKADTGEEVWKKNYKKDFGGRMMSGWGYSESVLIDGDKLICTPGADSGALVALNPGTGETIWKAAIPRCGGAGYSSPIKATLSKIPMYLTVLGKSGGVVAVHADTGKLLWQYTKVCNGTANAPTVIVRDDLVWCSTGYRDGGSALLKMTAAGDKVSVEELKYYDQGLQNHHGGMVLVGEHVYFGANHNQGFPACVEFKTGALKYKEEKPATGGGGSAAVLYADGMLYYRYQNHTLVLVEASPDGLKVVSSFKLPDWSRVESWAHPVIANGKLYIHDQDKLHCFNVKAGGEN
jgi:outer membrane protein assembly factor BamB